METAAQIIELAAGDVAAELHRQGIADDEQVVLIIAPERDVIPGRRQSRAQVTAAGLSDADIDRMIKQAQRDVEPLAG